MFSQISFPSIKYPWNVKIIKEYYYFFLHPIYLYFHIFHISIFFHHISPFRLTSTSILHAGLATHFCKSELLQGLRKELLECNGDEKRIQEVLDKYQSNSVNNAKEVINHDAVHQLAAKCNSVYNSDDMREILHNLNMMNNEWSQHQLSLIGKACPLSLK